MCCVFDARIHLTLIHLHSHTVAWVWAIVAAILIAVVLALVMVVNRKAPGGLLRPIIDLVHRMTAMLMFTAEWPSSLRDAGNAISGMMGGNVIQFVSPACIGIGKTFYSRFGLTVGIFVGVIAGIWAKAMCTICKHKRKMAKQQCGGGQVDGTIDPEEKVLEDDNGVVGIDDGSSTSSSALVLADQNGSQALVRTIAIINAGQDSIIIILLMYPGISGNAMQFFRCRKIDDVDYMMVDYSLRCYDGPWRGMLVLIVLVLLFLAIGSPALMFWLLYKKRHKIKAEAKAKAEEEAAKAARALLPGSDDADENEENANEGKKGGDALGGAVGSMGGAIGDFVSQVGPAMASVGGVVGDIGGVVGDLASGAVEVGSANARADPLAILYEPYRPELYFYEPIKMLFKLALWCALVLFSEGSEMQLGFALIINTVQLVVHVYLLPLRGTPSTPAWQINMLESMSLMVICFLTFAAFATNAQRVSLKAFPKREKEIGQNIEGLMGMVEFLTFAQFGALLYTILRTQWKKRHEHGKKFQKMKTRASSSIRKLRSRSSLGSERDRRVEMTINVNADAAFMAGVLNADSTADQQAAPESVTPWRFSAAATTSQVAPSESGEGGAVVTDGDDGEEKYWAANPIVEHQGRTGSVGV